jgi:hypothetical protein
VITIVLPSSNGFSLIDLSCDPRLA